MENLLNYYFIMKKRFVTVLLACSLAGGLFAQQPWFKDKDLTLTGAYYYPEHWDESQWERDFKQMHDLGFEFTHFAEFAWAQLEPEEGKYDFAWLDKAVALAAKYDLKVIMCTSTATPPVWLSRKYPEILIKNENGTVLDHGARQHASFASPVYRELAYKMIVRWIWSTGSDKNPVPAPAYSRDLSEIRRVPPPPSTSIPDGMTSDTAPDTAFSRASRSYPDRPSQTACTPPRAVCPSSLRPHRKYAPAPPLADR